MIEMLKKKHGGKMYKCSICDLIVETIPESAVQLGKAKGPVAVYQFVNGAIHCLVSTNLGAKKKAAVKEEVWPVSKQQQT